MTKNLEIMLFEDDELIQSVIVSLLDQHSINCQPSFSKYLKRLDKTNDKADLLLIDLKNQDDPDGSESIAQIPKAIELFPNATLVVQSGISEPELMRQCIQQGASRFISKEHISIELPYLLEQLKEERTNRETIERLIIGKSPSIQNLRRELIQLKSRGHSSILLEGETGSGKEVFAQAFRIPKHPFIPVNVSAIPDELFESELYGSSKGAFTGATQHRKGHFSSAQNGVLFLDEIQSLNEQNQVKLLRVLESRKFMKVGSSHEEDLQARIICASNSPLKEEVAVGNFREDLYYRISSTTLNIPPLRVRKEDIPLLCQHFLKNLDELQTKSFTPEALKSLKDNSYDWPGNVRELRNLVATLIQRSSIPLLDAPEVNQVMREKFEPSPCISARSSLPQSKENFCYNLNLGFSQNINDFEAALLKATLEKCTSTQECLKLLKMSKSRFYEKIKKYNLNPKKPS